MQHSKQFLIIVLVIGLLSSMSMAQTHFTFTSETGTNATLIVPTEINPNLDGTALVNGDEIGAFTPAGLCVGAAVWTAGQSAAITAWGDNDQTGEVDGLKAGEKIHYRVWQQATDTESEDATVTYSQGDGNYAANAVLILASLDATAPAAGGTKIKDIQFTEDPSGDTPLDGQEVTVSGIVVAEHRGENRANGGISSSYFFLMDEPEAWSGIQVYYKDSTAAEGDSLTITGIASEYKNQTQIGDITEFIRHSTRNPLPGPVDVTTAEANSEAYEGCLVRVNAVTIVETGIGSYNNWKVDDGSGAVKIDTRAEYYYTPVDNAPVKSLTGIVLFGYGEYSVAPSLAWDIVDGGDFTRIQRIQQVRNSDLLLAFKDQYSDSSYASADTLSIRGVVTMPTGLSYAGSGIKFILSEIGGGPWSSILSYHSDSTAYPVLYEGDIIEMSGYIGEYRTGPSNMSEFWITSPIVITDIGQPIPEPDTIETGDLRLPVDAEQWGNCMVAVKDAEVVDVNLAYELFALDDGTGKCLVDDDSDSLDVYYSNNPLPPLGTIAESMRGWVYHHYGSYADCTAYKLEPLYMNDIVWGVGPPTVKAVKRNIGQPTSADDVTISAEVITNLSINEVAIYYDVLSGETSTGYTKAVMANTTGDMYEGQIPKQANGSFVNYFVEATDDLAQTTMVPADTSVENLCYAVKDGPLSIRDIQYTPWALAVSPFEGYPVEVSGIVTVDTSANNKYEAYSIQDAEGEWNGIFAFGIKADLNRGDEITISGTVTDYNPDWGFKWDNNTVILVDSFKLVSSGNSMAAVGVTTGVLSNDGTEAEPYEAVLVKIENAVLQSVNKYDITFDDGSGACLVDADFMLSADQDENDTFYINMDGGYVVAFGDTLYPGDKVDMIQGVFTFSFGTYKIEIRDAKDFGTKVGVDPDFKAQPLTYTLGQNFPNPFNPETRIYFQIPQSQNVRLVIYNLLGQRVRTLVDNHVEFGQHVINWDGRDNYGNAVPSGVYIYRIMSGDFLASKKMLMLK